MALLGARGETKEEMRSALALPANDTDIIQGKIIIQLQCFILCDKVVFNPLIYPLIVS
jgi:hypothetical protein